MKLDHDEAEAPVDPGDDTILLRIIVHWVNGNIEATTSPDGSRPCGHIGRDKDGAWRLAFAVPRGEARQRHFIDVDPMGTRDDRWPLYRLGPGVWDSSKPVHIEGQFRGFVTVVGVPEPAPWEVPEGVLVKVKEPRAEDLVEFVKAVLTRATHAMPFEHTSLGVAIYHRPNIVFVSVNESAQMHAEFKAGIIQHLKRAVSS